MDFIENSKQFLEDCYPRDHLYFAGALTLVILIFLALPHDEKITQFSAESNKISIPIRSAASEETQRENSELSNVQEEIVANIQTPTEDLWQNFVIKSGDNLSDIFSKVGLTDQDLFRVLNSSEQAQILNRIYPGYELGFFVPNPGQLDKFLVLKSPLEGIVFVRENESYKSKKSPRRRRSCLLLSSELSKIAYS